MSTHRGRTNQAQYERAAREFSTRLLERCGAAVHSVVLYGSVARAEADEDSDIDVLVLGSNGHPDRREMIDIGEAVDYDNGYATRLIPTGMTAEKLLGLSRQRFPVAEAILSEGVVLYDDGTFQRLREASVGVGGRNVN